MPLSGRNSRSVASLVVICYFDVNRRAAVDIQDVAGKVNLLVDKVGDLDDQLRALRSFAPPTPNR